LFYSCFLKGFLWSKHTGPVTHSGKILTTGKSHGKKQDRCSLITVLAPKLVMCTCWQNIIYTRIFLIILLNCDQGRGNGNSVLNFNKTYLPDSFTVLFAVWVFLVFLTQQQSAFEHIPLPLYQPV